MIIAATFKVMGHTSRGGYGRHDEGACVQGDSRGNPETREGRGPSRIWVILVGLACLVVAGAWIANGRQAKTQQQAKATG